MTPLRPGPPGDERLPEPPEAAVVYASGDLDAVTARGLRCAVEETARGGASLVVVDLTDVRFVDSAGLAALVGAHRQLADGQQLALANVPARMQRVLRIAGIGVLFRVHEQGQPWPWPNVPQARPAPEPG